MFHKEYMTIWRAMRRGSISGAAQRGRAAAVALGVTPNPIGGGNSKTDLPGSYRPTGPTCPPGCPWLDQKRAASEHSSFDETVKRDGKGGCYTQTGNVALHQRRASVETRESAFAAFIAMVTAALTGVPARLHVSGGFAKPDGGVDAEYIDALCAGASFVGRKYKRELVAFTYTAFSDAVFDEYRARLADAGIRVLSSNSRQAGGSLVRPTVGELRAMRAELRADGLTLMLCPAQLTHNGITCRECVRRTGGCTTAHLEGRVIGFSAQGQTRRRIERALS